MGQTFVQWCSSSLNLALFSSCFSWDARISTPAPETGSLEVPVGNVGANSPGGEWGHWGYLKEVWGKFGALDSCVPSEKTGVGVSLAGKVGLVRCKAHPLNIFIGAKWKYHIYCSLTKFKRSYLSGGFDSLILVIFEHFSRFLLESLILLQTYPNDQQENQYEDSYDTNTDAKVLFPTVFFLGDLNEDVPV